MIQEIVVNSQLLKQYEVDPLDKMTEVQFFIKIFKTDKTCFFVVERFDRKLKSLWTNFIFTNIFEFLFGRWNRFSVGTSENGK